MNTTTSPIQISGAGLAGLSAAIVAARTGTSTNVYERHSEVGYRFRGEFQGLENWTTEGDVLEELAAIGVEPTFACIPFYEVVLFEPDGRARHCRDTRPIFYVVERGPGETAIDRCLCRQAQSLGARITFGAPCNGLPEGGIVASGPGRAGVIAVGYLFETDAADGAYCSLSPKHAREGYAYVLVYRGRGVIATCLFGDFHNERYYLGETVEFFESKLAINMRHKRRFGGAGTYSLPGSAYRNGVLLAGEAAGFQDAFAGFGMRYALLSGQLAVAALLAGEPQRYDALWRARFGGQLRAGLVNRYLYRRAAMQWRGLFAAHFAGTHSVRATLRRRYANSLFKALILPFARRALARHVAALRMEPGCHCTWCRCESFRRRTAGTVALRHRPHWPVA